MKNKKVLTIIISLFILIIISISMLLIYKKYNPNFPQNSLSTSEKTEKEYTVKVYEDGDKVSFFTYTTSKKYLGESLLEEGLIQGEDSAYGLFITTVQDRKADSSKNEWWKIIINGEEATTGVDQILIHDNDIFELILTVGY